MTPELESFYLELGQAAVDLAPDLAGRLLLYAEVEDGEISADVFYLNQRGEVRYRPCPPPTVSLIYEFWEQWKAHPGNHEWRTMSFVVEMDGSFDIDFKYPDHVNPEEDLADRRPRELKHYFVNRRVDYSRPN
jgi:hypothetical protein